MGKKSQSIEVDLSESCLVIWDDYERSLPAVLYHYTSAKGLVGVLTSRNIWATDIRFLNDASELQHGLDLIKATIQRRHTEELSEDRQLLYEYLFNLDQAYEYFLHVSIACFCEHSDLLSQWNLYGGETGGYAIGLNPEAFKPLLQEYEVAFLVNVIYETERQNEIVEKILNQIEEHYEQYLKSLPESADLEAAIEDFIFTCYTELWACVFRFKNDGFSQENEWRIIVIETASDKLKDMEFRAGMGSIVPYRRIRLLGNKDECAHREPLHSIVLGPTVPVELTRISLPLLLEKNGFEPDTPIIVSEIPYRGKR